MPVKRNKRKPKATKKLISKKLDAMVERLLFVAVGKDDTIQPFFHGSMPPEKLAQAAIDKAINTRRPRVGYLTKICRSESGQEYIAEPLEVELSSCLPDDAAPILQEHLDSVTHNSKHFICDAYIIKNGKGSISEDLATRLFDRLGAWDYKAKWETHTKV